jgi:hypothetical protein
MGWSNPPAREHAHASSRRLDDSNLQLEGNKRENWTVYGPRPVLVGPLGWLTMTMTISGPVQSCTVLVCCSSFFRTDDKIWTTWKIFIHTLKSIPSILFMFGQKSTYSTVCTVVRSSRTESFLEPRQRQDRTGQDRTHVNMNNCRFRPPFFPSFLPCSVMYVFIGYRLGRRHSPHLLPHSIDVDIDVDVSYCTVTVRAAGNETMHCVTDTALHYVLFTVSSSVATSLDVSSFQVLTVLQFDTVLRSRSCRLVSFFLSSNK